MVGECVARSRLAFHPVHTGIYRSQVRRYGGSFCGKFNRSKIAYLSEVCVIKMLITVTQKTVSL